MSTTTEVRSMGVLMSWNLSEGVKFEGEIDHAGKIIMLTSAMADLHEEMDEKYCGLVEEPPLFNPEYQGEDKQEFIMLANYLAEMFSIERQLLSGSN